MEIGISLGIQRGGGLSAIARAMATIDALSPTAWYHMRGSGVPTSSGGFASMWPDMADSDNGLVLPRTNSNYASTPGAGTAVAITGDRTYIVKAAASDYTPSATNGFFCKANGATLDFLLYFLTTGEVIATVFDSGGTQRAFRSTTGLLGNVVSNGESVWIKVTIDADNGSGGSTGKFYTSTDYDADTGSGTWTQLGPDSVVAATWTGRDTASSILYFGLDAPTFSWALDGVIHRVQIYSDLTQTTKVLDADFSAQAKGTTSFTESSSNGATVTINQSGALPAHIGSQKDLLQGTATNQPAYSAGVITFDGVDNYLQAVFALPQPFTIVAVVNQVSWTAADRVFDGVTALTAALQQTSTGATPDVRLFSTPSGSASSTDLVVGSYGIVCAVLNGASSVLRIDNNADIAANIGTTAAAGITVGSGGNGAGAFANPANAAFKEFVVFPSALSDANRSAVISALNTLNTVF